MKSKKIQITGLVKDTISYISLIQPMMQIEAIFVNQRIMFFAVKSKAEHPHNKKTCISSMLSREEKCTDVQSGYIITYNHNAR